MRKIISCVLISLFAVSCSVSISNLREDPAKYNGQTVALNGDVTETFSIPLTGCMIYLLYDRTGTIPVFTTKERKTGDQVDITAKVFAIETGGAVNNVDDVIKNITDYLKENDIIKGRFVDVTAKGIAKALKVILAKTEGSYLLIEKNKEAM